MAQDSDLSKSADKGKGKATDVEKSPEELQKDASAANGKKEDDKAECLFPAPAIRVQGWLTVT